MGQNMYKNVLKLRHHKTLTKTSAIKVVTLLAKYSLKNIV